jgi:hypothetical protein
LGSKPLRTAFALSAVCLIVQGAGPIVPLRFDDLPLQFASRFDRDSFPTVIESINRETAGRERDGEFDHLIAYALQSDQFTSEPKIEPAQSAREYVRSGATPPAVRRRLTRFLKAVTKPGDNVRLVYFSRLLTGDERNLPFLEHEYQRVMRFLYQKEFRGARDAYETRGHSTDTQVAANYAVWNALAVIKASAPAATIRKILIVGPGLDFAPRTELVDVFRPQSFQPYTIADAVLGLHLAQGEELQIDCVDINKRVIDYIDSFAAGNRALHLYSEPGVADYNAYFAALGNSIGVPVRKNHYRELPPAFLQRSIVVNDKVAASVHAFRLNIVTERLQQSYDLVIATNVLLYFNANELSLALTNIAKMLPAGGYFVHNDLRPVVEADGDVLQMPPVAARTVLIAQGQHAPLYDSFSICRKR